MNLYGLPEFVSYGILVGIAVVLIRQDQGIHLKYWLAGWIIILVHAGIFMLVIPDLIPDVIGRGLLALAGLAFMTAAYYQQSVVHAPTLLRQMGRVGLPNLAFAIASTAYVELHPDGQNYAPFAALIAIGAACAIWQALDKKETRRQSQLLVALACLVYGAQAWLLYAYGVLMASQWLMCWTYLAIAFFFLRQARTLTVGTVFTALSFVSWGFVFPVYSLLQIYAPDSSSHIQALVWNLPKFLTAACMLLVLLEEKVARATRLATHDELTGLPNRRLYEDRFNLALNRSDRNNSKFAVLIVDLNRFKQVNDTLGHHIGDDLLKVVSLRFRRALRDVDTVARTGGDEFTVMLEGVNSLAAAARSIQTLRDVLEGPVTLSGNLVDIGASIGAAIYPDDGATQTELHAVADARMYEDKQQGRLREKASSTQAR
ncbi:MAG TPA: GGDEF domain-containing protein [Magnetospirillaceae bacterium]|jgi:diguanylate cyclase (GGDEF)-like protein